MHNSDTPSVILDAARQLFARHGYDGASVRAITQRAGVNLGAITYHFGSKRALFEAVIAAMAGPARERIVGAADTPGAPLERIEAMVRAFFHHLYENPDLPQLMVHVMLSADPVPEAGRRTMAANVGTLARLIMEGQADGSIRPGDPRLMALSIASQPLWLALAHRVLREGISIDQENPDTRTRLVESVVDFVRAGLAADTEIRDDSVE